MIRSFGFLILTFALLVSDAHAQQVNFRHLGIDDGLSQNAVFSILQDQKGFLWFGTKDGLNRYDGREFVVYQHNPFDSTTISDPYVTELLEDSLGRIWLGTVNGDLNLFDRKTERFHRIPLQSGENQKLFTSRVIALEEGITGEIWMGTNGDGLVRVTPSQSPERKFIHTRYTYDPKNENGLPDNTVYGIHSDQNGRVWFGTNHGLSFYKPESDSFTHFDFDVLRSDSSLIGDDKKINVIYEDSQGIFWLGAKSGVIHFEPATGEYEYYPNRYESDRYGWGTVNHIETDGNGHLWLGTGAGLMHFDTVKKRYTYFQNDPFDPTSLSYDLITSLHIDNTGILWIGTAGQGISIMDPYSNRFTKLEKKPDPASRISGFSVRDIFEDDRGIVWLSTHVLFRWDRENGELTSFEASSSEPDLFGNTGSYSMIQTPDENIWAATSRGLFEYNPGNGSSRLFTYEPGDTSGLLYKEVNGLLLGHDNTIWIASRTHLSKMTDRERGVFKHFRFNPAHSQKLMMRPPMIQDNLGMLWVGTAEGLLSFDPEEEIFTHYRNDPSRRNSLSNNNVLSLLEDPAEPESIIWVGTSGGLNKMNRETGKFEHFTEEDGLPNEVIYGVLPDDSGNLWISTNQGLSRFDPVNDTFQNFDVTDGLQSNEFNTGAYFKSSSGELFFGGIEGLNYFYPDQIENNPHVPPIVLTSLHLENELITYRARPDILDAAISEASQILLSYREDVVTFEFAALSYSAPQKNRYAYKLEGYNEEWIESGNLASATYTNLPHGEYIFRIKGTNNDGLWNEEGASVALIVTPPWWHTWWAYSGYLLLFFAGLYLVRRYELKKFNLQNQLELEKVQTETLRNLDQLKSQFFANISHEIRTPLTLITGQVEHLLSTDLKSTDRERLRMISKNSERLLILINQLLSLSKLEAGKMEMQKEPGDLAAFINNILFSFQSLADSKEITLHFEAQPESIISEYDPDKMEQVFMNLISNAIKFTENGGKLSVSLDMKDPGTVRIVIEDTGIGIPESLLPYIFDRFYQVDQTSTRGFEGTGIGLALVHELIEMHDGEIMVESEVDVGTRFIILLDAAESEVLAHQTNHFQEMMSETLIDSSSRVSEPEFEPVQSDKDSVQRELIIVIEDHPDVRAFIVDQLKDQYIILEASNGEEGLSVSQNEIPDLIITDLMMPNMDGYQFTSEIRNDEKTSHIPIIMLTAKGAVEDKIEGLETGVDAYITKPFNIRELRVRVRALLEQRKKLRKQFREATVIKPSDITDAVVDQTFLEKAIDVVESNIGDEGYKVEDFANHMNMSISQLNRKLNALVDQPAGQFIRSIRLQRAEELLKKTQKTVAEICYMVGFNDQSYFSRAFKKQFGHSPSEIRKS
ncbi:MAG: two-component regulator propeller domain-containing protein [Balneolaceae bacterium]|nr:two-component regulator propeller domain-containing protein [Balneolaceae bacterium]